MPTPKFALSLTKGLPVSKTWFAVALALVAVIGAALWPGVGEAQGPGGERDYVDVELILEVPPDHVGSPLTHHLNIAVVNHGSRTAYDVEVVVNIEYPEKSGFQAEQQPIATRRQVLVENDGRSLRWLIPSLGGLQREAVSTRVANRNTTAPGLFDHRDYPHEHSGKVTTSSFESELHKGNNTARVWSYRTATTDNYYHDPASNYTVAASVDEPSPSPGDTVKFTITTDREKPSGRQGLTPPLIDLKVDIELTGGLSVSGTPTYPAPFPGYTKPDSVSYSNGVFYVGTLKAGDSTLNSVTLPVTVASNADVNEQCLTATLTGNPPPGVGPYDDDISDNVAKMCLGEQPVEPLVSGQVDAFTIYPCVGITDAPCDSGNDVRVRAVNSIGRALSPGTPVFHIDSLEARKYDAKTGHSVNDGDTVSWQTAVSAGRPYTSGVSSGVELYYSRTPFANKTSGWGGIGVGISARDVDSNTPPPGKVFLRSTSNGNAIRKAESPNFEHLLTTPTGTTPGTSRLNLFLEFEKLGTYKFTWHAVAKRSSLHGSENCNPDGNNVNQIFCASETYTFHVGPMADLAVEDGEASSHPAANRNALTIVAVNNGPNEPPGGARVTGLPTGAEVIHVSQGNYDRSTGVWNVGELNVRGWYRSAGMSEPTLVLGASAGDTANVNIESAKNYEVCIGPKSNPVDLPHTTKETCEAVTDASWNSTPVYDYKPDNNTAKITAVK